jgi:hypothetical protein
MATTHLPSIVQAHSFSPFDPLKTEKFFSDDHEYEISKWLKLENEPLPGLGSSYSSDLSSSSFYSSPATVPMNTNSQLPTLQPEFSNNYTSAAFSFSLPSTSSSSQSTQLPPSSQLQTPVLPSSAQQPYNSAAPQVYTYQYTTQYPNNQYQTIQYTTTTSTPPHFSQYAPAQYSSQGSYSSQFAPSYVSTQYNTSPTYSNSQYASSQYQTAQYLQPTPYSTSASSPQYAQGVVPTQLFQQQYSNSSNGTYNQTVPPQFQYLFSQYHPIAPKNQSEDLVEDKKRKQVRPFVRRIRQTRPKVVEAKGAVQCKGRNRKKGTQCRNAALMEYIGPRPIYCAEHIELDPKSLYEKCKSTYQKEPGDNKGCKEVVLKEFGICYKHYPDMIQEMIESHEIEKTRRHAERITELLSQLEKDAAAAKKKDGDLYQRKNKLIPKFQEMKKLVVRALESIDSRQKDLPEILPSELSQIASPIVLDGLSVHHMVEGLSSDDDCLSSPISDSSLEDEFEQILN